MRKSCKRWALLYLPMVLLVVTVLVALTAAAVPGAPEKLSMTDVSMVSSDVGSHIRERG